MTESKKPRGRPVEHPMPGRMIIQPGAGHIRACVLLSG